ncbi:MAG: PASTA domain-containing protein [Peptostreptococcaceae bacterium]|nr:PASTA domain-containing protein [Peptostreptococcaceae bacterium]
MTTNGNKTKKRIIIGFTVICVVFTLMIVRVGWVQIVKGEDYQKFATKYQTQDVPIPAKRGAIYDRNGKDLAISALTYSIWVTPGLVQSPELVKNADEKFDATIDLLAKTLELEPIALKSQISESSTRIKIAKYVSKEKADAIKTAAVVGIDIQEDVKRYYPLGAFASQVLGSVTDDNRGLVGLERKYNLVLSGTPGRWIKNVDVKGNSLSYGIEKYYRAEDGLSLVLTIDEVVQHYTEKALATAMEKTGSNRGMAIVMETKTGDILSMAMSPDYDPNNPRVPVDPVQAAYVESLSDEDKMNYWNNMWRNPMISDTFEPGSTFKLLTTAMALEEGLTNLNEHFYDSGSINVSGTILKCWRYYDPHGDETLIEAVGNSCNPVFVQLAQRIGYDKYFEYLELFGITRKTGIDFPGEGNSLIQTKEGAGPVGLATMAYGQGIAVTPINLITAISAFGNDGKIMKPRFVKALIDKNGKTVQEFEPQIVRQVVSKKTAEEVAYTMEAYVETGASGTKVAGYRVGAKTGTANKAIAGGYSSDTDSSSIAIAPMDDPRITVLVIMDSPKGVQYGSGTASPAVKEILENTLRYLNIQPSYSKEEEEKINSTQAIVPPVTGKSFSEVIAILASENLRYAVSPERIKNEDFTVIDQYPKAGEKIIKEGIVYLYRE